MISFNILSEKPLVHQWHDITAKGTKHPFVLMPKWNDYKHITEIMKFTKISWENELIWDMRWHGNYCPTLPRGIRSEPPWTLKQVQTHQWNGDGMLHATHTHSSDLQNACVLQCLCHQVDSKTSFFFRYVCPLAIDLFQDLITPCHPPSS